MLKANQTVPQKMILMVDGGQSQVAIMKATNGKPISAQDEAKDIGATDDAKGKGSRSKRLMLK